MRQAASCPFDKQRFVQINPAVSITVLEHTETLLRAQRGDDVYRQPSSPLDQELYAIRHHYGLTWYLLNANTSVCRMKPR